MHFTNLVLLGLAGLAIAIPVDDAASAKHKHHKGVGCVFIGTPPVCLLSSCPLGTAECTGSRTTVKGSTCVVGHFLRCCKTCPTRRSLDDADADAEEE